MSKFRTKKNQRTTYIYKDARGRKVAELKPGENGVTVAMIAGLHAEDDAVHNTAKRDSYHGLVHYDQDLPGDRQVDLADSNAKTVQSAGYDPYEHKVMGITAMERTLGKVKFAELLSGLVEKPKGKPTLVPDSDKRPAIHTAADDFVDQKL